MYKKIGSLDTLVQDLKNLHMDRTYGIICRKTGIKE